MKKITLFALAIAILCASPLILKDAHAKKGGVMHEKMMSELGLSQEQKDKLSALKTKHRSETKSLMEEKKSLREKMKTADSNVSDADLRKLHLQMKEVRSKLSDLRFENMLAVRAVLTPEQRKKMKELKEQRKEKWEKRKGMKRYRDSK